MLQNVSKIMVSGIKFGCINCNIFSTNTLLYVSTLILYCIYTGVSVSFIPSQAITIQQTTVYKCSVDNKGVSIQWIVNRTTSTDSSITDLGIITYGVATRNSSLTIPGNPDLNNTIVTCIAAGLVDMMRYNNRRNATLFIQGIIICIMLLYIIG